MATFPFTQLQFLEVFSRYNLAVWPAQVVLYLLAAAAIVCAIKKSGTSDRIISGILGLLWLWMGLVYHILFFSSINPVAFLFGILFIGEAIILWHSGVIRKATGFHVARDGFSAAGLLFIVYALVLYPVIGTIAGQTYPGLPTFGLPCPTTIFTFGMFLLADQRVPLYLIAIPLLWSFIGVSAALSLGIAEDYGLIVAGVLGTALIALKNRG